jgi:hypothetical protein
MNIATSGERERARACEVAHMTHCLVNHHITGHLVFVLVSTERVMTCPAIDNPASCKIRAAVRFLHAENMSAADIHHELCAAVYAQNVMS